MTGIRPTYAIPDEQERAHRALVRAAIHTQTRAAARWLDALRLYVSTLDALAERDDASDNTLTAAFQEAFGLNTAAAALAVGLPEAAQ